MRLVWIQFLFVFGLVSISGGMTSSYFFDLEGNNNNLLSAAQLDAGLSGPPLSGSLCSTSDRLSTEVLVSNLDGTLFEYNFGVEDLTGELCGGLIAQLRLGEEELYDGPLAGLLTEGMELPATTTDTLTLRLRLDPLTEVAGSCNFTTTLSAYLPDFAPETGYYDLERTMHMVSGSTSGVGGSCTPDEPGAQLHVNKHISGDQNGFKLSDFFYHITGNGIDITVPHDTTVSIPVGTYTIEEIVPEGFVKPDWRIGWYGECESGNAFSTTIEVEDHDVGASTPLECEADNQYRPGDDNTPDEEEAEDDFALIVVSSPEEPEHPEVIEETTPEPTSTDAGRGDRPPRTGR